MFYIHILPQLKDNYSYILRDEEANVTCVIDPSTSKIVEEFLNEKNWNLDYILNTHHHNDHIGGNERLKERYNAKIIASIYDDSNIKDIDIKLKDGDEYKFPAHCNVIHIPGHTLGHIAYYFPEESALFCGDTLFSLGCGKLFEGTYEQLFNSLKILARLPNDTKIYPGHEYTLNNAKFALSVEPDNNELKDFYEIIEGKRSCGEITIPSDIRTEKRFNPFLRTNEGSIKSSLEMNDQDELSIFTELRIRKNNF